MDQIDKIIAYESGELDEIETIELFQELIDSGLAWQLQGHYGRTAAALINAGYCFRSDHKYTSARNQIKEEASYTDEELDELTENQIYELLEKHGFKYVLNRWFYTDDPDEMPAELPERTN